MYLVHMALDILALWRDGSGCGEMEMGVQRQTLPHFLVFHDLSLSSSSGCFMVQ